LSSGAGFTRRVSGPTVTERYHFVPRDCIVIDAAMEPDRFGTAAFIRRRTSVPVFDSAFRDSRSIRPEAPTNAFAKAVSP